MDTNYLTKISFIIGMLLFGFVILQMARFGFLLEIILQYPFTTLLASGIVLYSFAFLFDFIFFRRVRLFDVDHLRFHFLIFLAIWFAIGGIVFFFLIPPLNLATIRIIFRPLQNCNAFDKPPVYLCYTLGNNNDQLFYTTERRECVGTVTNATSFYIISLWKPAINQFKLNKNIMFYPLPRNESTKYALKKDYCIQAAGNLFPNDGQIEVAFYSWDGKKKKLEDRGYINRSDLDEYNTGWFKVSNCMWELSRLLPLNNYCITGYVSSFYVNVPQHMKEPLHVNEH